MRIEHYRKVMAFAVIAGIMALVFSGCPQQGDAGTTAIP